MSGKIPFHENKSDPLVCIRLDKDERPDRPPFAFNISVQAQDKLWALIQDCWNKDPSSRPTIQKAASSELWRLQVEESVPSIQVEDHEGESIVPSKSSTLRIRTDGDDVRRPAHPWSPESARTRA